MKQYRMSLFTIATLCDLIKMQHDAKLYRFLYQSYIISRANAYDIKFKKKKTITTKIIFFDANRYSIFAGELSIHAAISSVMNSL